MTTRRIKKCNRCKAALDASEFHRNLAAKDGLQGRCKQCHVKGNAKYRSGRKLKSLSDMGYKNALADMDQAFEAAGFSDHARDQCEAAIRARGAKAEREKIAATAPTYIEWTEGDAPGEDGWYLVVWTVEGAPEGIELFGVYTFFARPNVGHKSLGVMQGWQVMADTTRVIRHAKINTSKGENGTT